MIGFIKAPRENLFENEYGFMWISDGILCVEYKPVVIGIPAVESMIEARVKMCNTKMYPSYTDGRLVKYWTMESRKYSFQHKDAYTGLKSVAFVNASPMGNAVINWVLRFMNPKVPMKLFTSSEKALEWCRRFQ